MREISALPRLTRLKPDLSNIRPSLGNNSNLRVRKENYHQRRIGRQIFDAHQSVGVCHVCDASHLNTN